MGIDGPEDIIVYRHSAICGWNSWLYKAYTYTHMYLGIDGAWMCNESYMIVPGKWDNE